MTDELLQRTVSHRRARGRTYGTAVHTVRVLHKYGPHGVLLHVKPLCSVGAGRAELPGGGELPCKTCAAILAKECGSSPSV